MGIRSERRLREEVHLNLAYRWFCRLDLTDPAPDHSTFSKNWHGRSMKSLGPKVFGPDNHRVVEPGNPRPQRPVRDLAASARRVLICLIDVRSFT